MKHAVLFLSIMSLLLGHSIAQVNETHYFNSDDYSKLKAKGELPAGNVIELGNPSKEIPSTPETIETVGTRAGGCGCYIDPDPTYTLAMAPNDDLSTGLIALPFTFCLYGTNYNSLYINNNGNVSFGTPYGTFSASGFPSPAFVMVAPFWGDVDTRPDATHGTVKYKIYPNAIYVNWEGTGYYSMMNDKLNTFQLILSDGTDTTIGVGNNVAFCYKDMQWTTGAASSGIGGFGGVPATVGANKGDGINFIQFGRFDHAGTDYDGPIGVADGVSWLDNQSFKFSTCVTSGNVEPVFIDFSPDIVNISYDCGTSGDTLKICSTGDTLIMSAQVLDPNVSDIVTLTVTGPGIFGFSVLSSSPGNPATITWQMVADPANYGFNNFTVTATDNGVPALSATATVSVFVDTTGIGAFTSTISGDTMICSTETTTLSVPALFDTYDWTTGATTNTSGLISSEGDYAVTLSLNGCYKSITQHVYEWPDPVPAVSGSLSLCMTPTTVLSTSNFYSSYNWTFNGGFVSNADTAFFSAPGTVVLTVTDTNGCTGDSTYTIVSGPTVDVTGPAFICSAVGTIDLAATANTNGTYLWDTGGTDSILTVTTTGMYNVTFTDLTGCVATDSQFVNIATSPDIFISTLDSIGCPGETITLSVGGTTAGGSITWSTGATTSSISVTSGTLYSVSVDNSSCIDTDSIFLVFSNPSVSIGGPASVCSPGVINLIATGSLPGTYSWSNGDTDSLTTASTTGTYTVTFTDVYGCTDTDAQLATIITTPNITITTSDSVVCAGDNIVLTVSGTLAGGTILWTPGGSTSSSITVTSGTSYSVTVTNTGCADTDVIPVVFNVLPTVNIVGPTETCENVPITITANASTSGTYLWNTGETTSSIIPTSTGTYTITFTDANGCVATDSQLETINPVPNADFVFSSITPISPSSLPLDVDFTSTSTIAFPGTIVSYTYTVNDTITGVTSTTSHDFTYYGVHVVTLYVVSDQGCIDSVTHTFEVAPILLIPNIFTPNSSPGYNDVFEIESLFYFSPATLKIFDRWGVNVYESNDYRNDWGGTKNGNPVSEGVYYYELILVNGDIYTGYVHISRN